MFSCSSGENPYPFIGQTLTDTDYRVSQSDQQNLPSYSSNFADPFFEDDDLFLKYLLTHHHLLAGNTSEDPTDSIAASNIEADTNNESNNDAEVEREIFVKPSSKGKGKTVKQTIPRKRSGKKDRHSKICTAQGTRDRRMRLSLPVARKFFDLQDLLGFDKASKTIEWLFSKSKAAIKELEQNILKMKQYTSIATKSLSSTAESEVFSRAGEAAESSDFNKFAGCLKEKKSRKLHKVAKESRDMARARARVRTREKMVLKGLEVSPKEGSKVERSGETYIDNQEMIITLKTRPDREEEEASNHGFLGHQMNSVNIYEKDLHCLLSPSSALEFSHDEGQSGGNKEDYFPQSFTRNWEIEFDHVEMQFPHCTVPQMKMLLAANDQGQIPNGVINHFKLQTSQAYLPL